MPWVKEKNAKNKKYDADRILLHVRDVILEEEYSPEQLPELVEAYAHLLDVRLDIE